MGDLKLKEDELLDDQLTEAVDKQAAGIDPSEQNPLQEQNQNDTQRLMDEGNDLEEEKSRPNKMVLEAPKIEEVDQLKSAPDPSQMVELQKVLEKLNAENKELYRKFIEADDERIALIAEKDEIEDKYIELLDLRSYMEKHLGDLGASVEHTKARVAKPEPLTEQEQLEVQKSLAELQRNLVDVNQKMAAPTDWNAETSESECTRLLAKISQLGGHVTHLESDTEYQKVEKELLGIHLKDIEEEVHELHVIAGAELEVFQIVEEETVVVVNELLVEILSDTLTARFIEEETEEVTNDLLLDILSDIVSAQLIAEETEVVTNDLLADILSDILTAQIIEDEILVSAEDIAEDVVAEEQLIEEEIEVVLKEDIDECAPRSCNSPSYYRQEISKMATVIAQLQEENANLKSENRELKTDMSEMTDILQNQMDNVTEEVSGKYVELDHEYKKLFWEHRSLTQEMKEVEDEMEKSKSEKAKLEKMLASACKELKPLEDRNHDLCQEMDNMNKELDSFRAMMKEILAKKKAADKAAATTEDIHLIKDDNKKLRQELKDLRSNNNLAVIQPENVQKLQQRNHELQMELDKLRSQLQSQPDDVDNLRKKQAVIQEERDKLASENTQLLKNFEQLVTFWNK